MEFYPTKYNVLYLFHRHNWPIRQFRGTIGGTGGAVGGWGFGDNANLIEREVNSLVGLYWMRG